MRRMTCSCAMFPRIVASRQSKGTCSDRYGAGVSACRALDPLRSGRGLAHDSHFDCETGTQACNGLPAQREGDMKSAARLQQLSSVGTLVLLREKVGGRAHARQSGETLCRRNYALRAPAAKLIPFCSRTDGAIDGPSWPMKT